MRDQLKAGVTAEKKQIEKDTDHWSIQSFEQGEYEAMIMMGTLRA